MQASQHTTLGAFRLNKLYVEPGANRVSGAGGEVHFEPKVMAVLLALSRNPGKPVSRSELLSDIWPGGDVYDEALTQCIYQLRQLLGVASGDGSPSKLITTVPKRGYILQGEIVHDGPQAPAGAPGVTRADRKHYLVAAVLVLLLFSGIWTVYQWRSTPNESIPVSPRLTSIAVLPFLPLFEAQSDPALELGMADTLIARLSGIEQIIVRPVTLVRAYGDIGRDSLKAGAELGVDAVVEGNIQRSGETVRVTSRLLRVADGVSLWAGTFEQPFTSIFELQDDICARISNALAVQMGPADLKNLSRRGTLSTDAYELYIRGRLHMFRLTRPDMNASVAYFREAIALDPAYTQAWIGLASALFRIPLAIGAPSEEYYPEAKAAALKALEIDGSLAEPHAILGWIAFWFEWDWPASESHFQNAIKLNPNDFDSHLGYAHLLSNTGRHEAALAEARRARELNPYFLLAAVLEAGFFEAAGNLEGSLSRLEEARLANEQFWLTRVALAGVMLALGRPEQALVEARQADQLSGGNTYALATEIPILVQLGQSAEAESILLKMQQQASQDYISPYTMALAFAGLGDTDAALDWLEKAYQANDPKMTFLATEPLWKSMRENPGMVDLLGRMNLLEAVR